MKRRFAVLLAAALLFCLAACGAETADAPDASAATVEAATDAAAGTAALSDHFVQVGAIKAQLSGAWSYAGYDGVKLTFRDNGTGSYLGLDGAERSFLYLVNVSNETYANGAEYVNNVLIVKYDNGRSEQIAVDFPEEDGTKLVLHSVEENGNTGGYSGLIDFDEWTKE